MTTMTIGQLAASAGVAVDTIRYYERSGLLTPAARSASGYRIYGDAERERLRFIRGGKALGFSLDDIRTLLALVDEDGDRSIVRSLAAGRLADIERKLVELARVRDTLERLVRNCRGHGSTADCPIVDAVVRHADVPETAP